jgi:hypothetical protein
MGIKSSRQSLISRGSTTTAISGFSEGVSASSIITSISYLAANGTVLTANAAPTVSNSIIKIVGTGFTSGANVYLNGLLQPSANVTFVNSTELRLNVPPLTTNTYSLMAFDSTGAGTVYYPGVRFDPYPIWTTGTYESAVLVSTQFLATGYGSGSISFSLASGNTLPSGLSLAANGLLSGTTSLNTYNFYVNAIDSENQVVSQQITLNVNPPTYSVAAAGAVNNINEGSSLTFNVTTTLVDNGTTLYWTANNVSTSDADFSASSGSFSITSNAGSFSITPLADVTTEGSETFAVSIRTGSTSGTVVATSSSITVNDTSTAVKYSNYFVDYGYSGSSYMTIPNTGALATALSSATQTREMWVKRMFNSSGRNVALFRLTGGDTGTFYINNGTFYIYNNGNIMSASESYLTYGGWAHVALVLSGGVAKLWIGGVLRSTTSTSFSASSGAIQIGGANDQGSIGYLSNIRISNIARYTETFVPPTAPFITDVNTVFLTAKSSTFIDESSSGLTISLYGTSNPTISTDNPF